MSISDTLRAEIERRGLTYAEIARGTGLPFATVSEFAREVRDISADRASKIAEYLGFDLVISKLRRKTMEKYLETVADLEGRGIPVDDESIEKVNEYVANLDWLERNCGRYGGSKS